MNKSLKKVVLAILLAIITIVACVTANGYSVKSTMAAEVEEPDSYTTIQLSSDKTKLTAGDTFTLTVEMQSTLTDYHWYVASFTVCALDGENNLDRDINSNFELVSRPTVLNSTYFSVNASGSFTDTDPLYCGALVSLTPKSVTNKTDEVLATNKIVIALQIKVKDDATDIPTFNFGVIPTKGNYVRFRNYSTNNTVTHAFGSSGIKANSVPMNVSAEEVEDPTAYTTIHLCLNKTELKAGDYFIINIEISTIRTDLYYNAIQFDIGALTESGKSIFAEYDSYFEYVSYTSNVNEFSFGKYAQGEGVGAFYVISGNNKISCEEDFVAAIIMKVSDDAPTIESLNFGIGASSKNYVTYKAIEDGKGIADRGNTTLAVGSVQLSITAK